MSAAGFRCGAHRLLRRPPLHRDPRSVANWPSSARHKTGARPHDRIGLAEAERHAQACTRARQRSSGRRDGHCRAHRPVAAVRHHRIRHALGQRLDVSQGAGEGARPSVNYSSSGTATGAAQTSEIITSVCTRLPIADSASVAIAMSGAAVGDTVTVTVTSPFAPITGVYDTRPQVGPFAPT